MPMLVLFHPWEIHAKWKKPANEDVIASLGFLELDENSNGV
jgi:hypothetical protein